MWWQQINERFLIQIISKINDSRARDNTVDCCSDLFDALNKCWQQYNISSGHNGSISDSSSLFFLLSNSLSDTHKRNITESIELKKLALLEPKVMNHDKLRSLDYDPYNISDELKKESQDEHNQLINSYKRFIGDKENPDYLSRLLKKVAQILYVIRSNIKHGEKTPKGPDINKSQRDKEVCEIVKPLVELIFELIFEFPSKRLAVYGTLLPGQPNHQIIAHLNGEWLDGSVKGRIETINHLKAFVWELNSPLLEIRILDSDQLPNELYELDRFEGNSYARILAPISISKSIIIANIYSLKE